MKYKLLILLILITAFAVQGCFFPSFRSDIDQPAPSDNIYLAFPNLIHLRNSYDKALYLYYLGDLKYTITSCDSLIEDITELKLNNLNQSLCAHLDLMEANTHSLRQKAIDEMYEKDWQIHVEELLDSLGKYYVVEEEIEIVYNWKTKYWLDYFQGKGRKTFQRWLNRVGKYRDIIEPILVENEISRDFLYLAVIESGLNSRARSYAKAVGPWQFMAGTGRAFNLRINWWIDERKDIVASTYAAAHYLNHLYELFGDWQLALAAYNSGQYRVAYAMSRQKTRDYWRLRLPDQTRWFVPKFMAALAIGRSPEKYGFKKPLNSPIKFDIIQIDRSTDLRLIAKAASCTYTSLRKLNPALRRWATPPDMSVHLKVPEGKGRIVLNKLSEIDPSKRVSWHSHIIKRGETISTIAEHYDLSQDELIRINKIRRPGSIRAGNTLMVPVKEINGSLIKSYPSYRDIPKLPSKIRIRKPKAPANYREVTYKVKSGDNLGKIADKFNIRLKDLRSWNNLKYTSLIKPGRKLTIFVPPDYDGPQLTSNKIKMVYIVKRGDTLDSICRMYDTSITNILKWNKGINKNKLYPGNRLTIFVDTD